MLQILGWTLSRAGERAKVHCEGQLVRTPLPRGTQQNSTAQQLRQVLLRSFVAPLLEVFVLLPLDFKTEVLDAHGDRARKTAASENGRHLGSWDRSPFSPRELQSPKHQNAKPAEIQPHKPGPERGTSMEARGVK